MIRAINFILKELDFKYGNDKRIYITDENEGILSAWILQKLRSDEFLSLYEKSKDVFFEEEYRGTEYYQWISYINTLKLFEYKRKLLWKYQKSIIHPATLEKISRFIWSISNAEWIIQRLKDCGVPEYLIIYPNTKWKMVNDIFRVLATSIYEDGHKLLFAIIEEFLSPLTFNTIEEWISHQENFSWFLNYDGYEIWKWKVRLLEKGRDMYDVYYETKNGERIDVKEYDRIKDMIANTDYKKITLLKWQDGQVNFIEWEQHIDAEGTKFVDLKQQYPYSDITAVNHDGKTMKYTIKEKIKLSRNS